MLAKIDWSTAPCEAKPLPDYSGFPLWEAFVTEPNRERKVADFLKEKLGIEMYWPHFMAKRRMRGSFYAPVAKAVFPCMLFAPIEFFSFDDREQVLDWVRMKPLKLRHLSKFEIDEVRDMEARLVVPLPKAGHMLRKGDKVEFVRKTYRESLVEGDVMEVAAEGRIRVKCVGKLFGAIDTFWISAAELVAK